MSTELIFKFYHFLQEAKNGEQKSDDLLGAHGYGTYWVG